MVKHLIKTGDVFGDLIVLRRVRNAAKGSKHLRIRYRMRCTCGKEFTTPKAYLHRRPNPLINCGCSRQSIFTKHKRMYNIWYMMHYRCTKPNHEHYKHYGGRGISVCGRWGDPKASLEDRLKAFQLFIDDMGEPTTPTHTLDRIDPDGNYEPGNCRWATPKEQANNKRKK